jgi:hypothetical protein
VGAAIAVSLSLVSCAAKSAPTRISVTVADNYSGAIHLESCVRSATVPVVTDSQGNGVTSACPYGDVELAVARQGKTIYIMPENVHVERTGDGIAVRINADLP